MFEALKRDEEVWFRNHWQAQTTHDRGEQTEFMPIPHEWLAHAMLLRLFCGWRFVRNDPKKTDRREDLSGSLIPPSMSEDDGSLGPKLQYVPKKIEALTLAVAMRGLVGTDQWTFRRWQKKQSFSPDDNCNLIEALQILRMVGYSF